MTTTLADVECLVTVQKRTSLRLDTGQSIRPLVLGVDLFEDRVSAGILQDESSHVVHVVDATSSVQATFIL